MKAIHAMCAGSAALICVGSANASATLIGDLVDVNLDGGIVLEDLVVLGGAGIELEGGNASTNFGAFLFPLECIDLGATTIDMVFELPLGSDGMLTFSDLDFGAGIGAVGITSDNAAVQAAQVSFTSASITLDATDWFTAGGPAPIPLPLPEVPAPGAAALAGLAGLAAVRRRR